MTKLVTYQDVFGVPVGGELDEARGVTFTPCPAVASLRKQLGVHGFFSGSKVGGTGPLLKSPTTTEYNRHHAGLAVDIMLSPGNAKEVALGHQLMLLLQQLVGVMKWRSVVYQNVTLSADGVAHRWTGGGHDDHIHVDWHDSANVKWRTNVTAIPLKRKNGQRVTLKPVAGNKIAESIRWTSEAMTGFDADATVKARLADVMARHAAGSLTVLDLDDALGVVGAASAATKSALAGRWKVAIGGWKGLFFFGADGGVSWAESDKGKRTAGRWWTTASEVQWKFSAKGDIRTFTVKLPPASGGTNGVILPAGQGWFEMRKA